MSATFDPALQSSVALALTRPSGYGTLVMTGGLRADFAYRIPYGTWSYLPANASREGSFVALPGSYQVAKRCTANGALLGSKTVTVSANTNRSTSIYGTCP